MPCACLASDTRFDGTGISAQAQERTGISSAWLRFSNQLLVRQICYRIHQTFQTHSPEFSCLFCIPAVISDAKQETPRRCTSRQVPEPLKSNFDTRPPCFASFHSLQKSGG